MSFMEIPDDTSQWHRAMRAFQHFRAWQPLTLRGFLALLLSVVALKAFALPEYDLVAYMLGGGILGILTITAITAVALRLRLGRQISAAVNFDEERCFSQSDVAAGITLRDSELPSYFTVQLKRKFAENGVVSPLHLVTGRGAQRQLVDTVHFPHRGLWALDALSLTLRDWLGFSELSWDVPIERGVEVSAQTIPIRPLPIVAASSRAGDLLNQSRTRSGDLFDLKPYDPSDGVKRILWKTFARSGELVVRRPEPAIIPEGEVAIYLVAAREHDHVAGALLSYLDQLEQNQITVLFGTDGMREGESEDIIVSTRIAIERAMNRAVWNENAGTAKSFESYLEALEERNSFLSRVIVFAPAHDTEWFDRVAQSASLHSVAITVALVKDDIVPSVETVTLPVLEGVLQKLSNKRPEAETMKELSASIMNHGAELLICESAEVI